MGNDLPQISHDSLAAATATFDLRLQKFISVLSLCRRIHSFVTVWLTLKLTNKVFDWRHKQTSVIRGIMSCRSQNVFDINGLYLGNGGQALLKACCWVFCCQFQWQIYDDESVGKVTILEYCTLSTLEDLTHILLILNLFRNSLFRKCVALSFHLCNFIIYFNKKNYCKVKVNVFN